jgi:phosphoribosylanthranilate isomerase
MTRPQDALAAAEAGADAISMVLHAHVMRLVQLKDARRIVQAVPPFVSIVGVFVDAETAQIVDTAKALGLSAVQLHGHETPQMVAALDPLRVIKSIQISDLDAWSGWQPDNLTALLIDAPVGGSGVDNDWPAVKRGLAALEKPIRWIAAGGLKPGNVGKVVTDLRPWGVDVSTGVEERPREKSVDLIRQFIAAVRQADAG